MSDQTLPQAPRNIYAYNRGNYTQINSALLQYDWNTLLCAGDVESAVRSFYQILYELRDRYVPLTKQKVKKFPPWYNIQLIKSIKEKYKYLMKYRTYGNLNDKLSFQLLRSRVKLLEEECYSRYINTVEESIAKNSKVFRSHMKRSMAKHSTSFFPKVMTY